MQVMKWFDRLLDVLFVVSGALLAFSSLSVGAMIFSRYFLNKPMGWMIEVNEYVLLHLTFLLAAWVLRKEAHVKMDILYEFLSPKVKAILDIVSSVVGAGVCFILTWFAVKVTWGFYKAGTITPTYLELPKYPLTCVIFLGSFLFMVQFLRRANGSMRVLRQVNEGKDPRIAVHPTPKGNE